MSNALWVLRLSAAAVGVGDPGDLIVSPFMTNVIAVGLCVLVAWCVWRAIRPAKLLLASAPGRKNTLTPVHILFLFLGYWLVNSGLYQVLSRTMDADSPQFQALLMLAALLSMLILGIIMAAYTFPLGLRRGFGLTARHWLNDTFRGVLGYLAVLPICQGLLLLSIWILPDSIQQKHQTLVILGKKLPIIWKAMAVFGAVILAPLAEEVFFRGLLQSMIRRYSGGAWPAIIISSAVFATMHFATPQAIVPLFALAVVLGYSYEHTGRLYRSILIHALFNAVAVADCLTRP